MNSSTNAKPTDEQLTQWGWSPAKPNGYWEDIAKQQAAFMMTPPPCGEIVEFRMCNAKDGLEGSIYSFNSSDVQSIAEKMIERNPRMSGLAGAAKWTSLRGPRLTSPTYVPPILRTFNEIAFELIEAGKGTAHCPLCNKTYNSTELVEGYKGRRYLFKIYSCPAQHELINVLHMHMLLKCDDESDAFRTA